MSNDYTVQVRVTVRLERTIQAESLEDAVEEAKGMAETNQAWLRKESRWRPGVTEVDTSVELLGVGVEDGRFP